MNRESRFLKMVCDPFLRSSQDSPYSDRARLSLFVLVQLVLFALTAVLLVGGGWGAPVGLEIMVANLAFFGSMLSLIRFGKRVWAEGITAVLLPGVFVLAVANDPQVLANPLALDLLLVYVLFTLVILTVTTSRSLWIVLAGVVFLVGGLWFRFFRQSAVLAGTEADSPLAAPVARYLVVSILALVFLVIVQRIVRRANDHASAAQERLVAANQTLETKVIQRTVDLESALVNLERAQKELVQNEKLAALGRLVAGVAHELNTPLGNALMMASHLKEGADRPDEFGALIRSLEKAATLVADFKQIAVDRTSERSRRFLLAQAFDDVMFAFRMENKDKPWQIRCESSPEAELDGDPGALVQVLGNLVENAVVHGFVGQTSGTVTLAVRSSSPGWLELSVSDDGVGIPPEVLDHVFDPFFTTTAGRGGTGLGLTICFNVVTVAWGGKISASSSPGRGSTFRVAIPMVAPGRNPSTNPPQ